MTDKLKDILMIDDSKERFETIVNYCESLENKLKEKEELYYYIENDHNNLQKKYEKTLDAIKQIPYVKQLKQELADEKSRVWDNYEGIQGGA